MSVTCDLQNHVFISYAHLDNQQGWIDEFHRLLKIQLDEFLGESTVIWRDQRLRVTDVIDDTILSELGKSAVFVCILSPRYVNSAACLKEIKAFFGASAATGGLRVGTKSRMVNLIKTEVPQEQHPPELHGSLFYEFYETDQAKRVPLAFSADSKDASYNRFKQKVCETAYAIAELLRAMRWRAKTTGETVYVAETTSDLTIFHQNLVNALHQANHTVLPDNLLVVLNAADLEKSVCENIKRSKLSIHLIGKHYSVIPEGGDRSLAEIQLVVARKCAIPERPHLVWIPPGLNPSDERQQEFLTQLRNELAGQAGIELIEHKSLEELKNVIYDKLKPSEKVTQASASSNGRRRVYLICDKQDFQDVLPIQNYLHAENLEISMPLLEGDPVQAKKLHKDNLRSCDGALIYYGLSSPSWYAPMFNDVIYKARAYRKRKDWIAKAVYVGPPQTLPKKAVLTHEALVIRHYDSFKPECLQPFLSQLRQQS